MDGKEAIVTEILSNAELAAASIVSDAENERIETLSALDAELTAKKQAELQKASAEAEELMARRMTLVALEERKTLLAAKQKLIDSVYYQTVSKILNMTDHIYRDFIGDIVAKFADNGDRIMVAVRDEKRLHAAWVEALSKKLGKTLILSEERHNGRGGVILLGRKYDKNLTFEALIQELRHDTEGAVVGRLFGR